MKKPRKATLRTIVCIATVATSIMSSTGCGSRKSLVDDEMLKKSSQSALTDIQTSEADGVLLGEYIARDFPLNTPRDERIQAPIVEFDSFRAVNCHGDVAIFGRAPANHAVLVSNQNVMVQTNTTADDDGMAPFCLTVRLNTKETDTGDTGHETVSTGVFLASHDQSTGGELSGKYSDSTQVLLLPRLDCDDNSGAEPITDNNIIAEANIFAATGALSDTENIADDKIETDGTLTLSDDGTSVIVFDFNAPGNPAWEISKINISGLGIKNLQAAFTTLPSITAPDKESQGGYDVSSHIFDAGWSTIPQTNALVNSDAAETDSSVAEGSKTDINTFVVKSAHGIIGPVRQLALRVNGNEKDPPAISTWITPNTTASETRLVIKGIEIWGHPASQKSAEDAQNGIHQGQALCP